MKHVTLSDFYMQWLQAIRSVDSCKTNILSPSLTLALKNRLKKLQDSKLFLAAVFLDPRFNFLGSNFFTSAEEKQSVQVIFCSGKNLFLLKDKIENKTFKH